MDINVNSSNIEDRSVEKALEQVSPFEIKNKLIALAEADAQATTRVMLNAGRGNPNWICVPPRQAFFLLGKFSMAEARRVWSVKQPGVDIAGMPAVEGAGARFEQFLAENANEEGCSLLKNAFDYLVKKKGAPADNVAQEWAMAMSGDLYPTPDRILTYTEVLLRDYLAKTMGNNAPQNDDWDLFATEGSTAGMCYAFMSIFANKLLKKGDKIALMTPIFTPYLEIPELARFDFEVVNINANAVEKDGYHDWQYPDEEINKLRDPSVKLVCLVNPSNPPSYTLSQHTLDLLVDIVKTDNPNLMVVSDDVYGTFVKDFKSLMYVLPFNTMCLYSFSKYWGATGWRIAAIALNKNNIFDKLVSELDPADKAALQQRYTSLTLDVPALKFIDRMVADSRMVALNHTAGLSTPQQMQMSLFAAAELLDTENLYQTFMMGLIKDRLDSLWKTTGFTLQPDPLRAGYYSEIDMMVWSKKFYGEDFANYLNANYEPLDFVIRLAHETAVVVLNGDGFDGPKWSVRVSLANLREDAYLKIGTAIRNILEEYHNDYLKSKK